MFIYTIQDVIQLSILIVIPLAIGTVLFIDWLRKKFKQMFKKSDKEIIE
jgi:hypothetical protein